MAVTYGVISDAHAAPLEYFDLAAQVLKKEGIDALILNGDIVGNQVSSNPQEYLVGALSNLIKHLNVPILYNPGNWEQFHLTNPVLEHVGKHYNVQNTAASQVADVADHRLIFVPGGDLRANNADKWGYSLEFGKNETSIYENEGKYISVFNANDLFNMVKDPNNTLVFSHVPSRFDGTDKTDSVHQWIIPEPYFKDEVKYAGGIRDIKYYPANGRSSLLYKPGRIISESLHKKQKPGITTDPELAKALIEGGINTIEQRNVGTQELGDILNKIGIEKVVSGHIHPAAGNAHDKEGNAIEEGVFGKQLFYNASFLDHLKVGMVSMEGGAAAYERIDLSQHLDVKPSSASRANSSGIILI